MALRISKKGKVLLAVIAAVAFALYYLFGERGLTSLHGLKQQEDSLATMRDSLQVEYENLQKRLKHLQLQNPETIEEEARNLNMAKPEEELIILQIDSSAYKPPKIER